MRIAKLETFTAAGGAASYHFLKVTTDDGLAGWSEYGDGSPSPGGLGPLILKLGERAIGQDPRAVRRLATDLYAATRFAAGGMFAQAIAAIQNACLDLKGKALGVPVHEMLGGALRQSLPVYWSHCGMYRVGRPDFARSIGLEPIVDLAGIEALGAEVKARSYPALKTNLLRFDAGGGRMHGPGFAPVGAGPALEATPGLIGDTIALLEAFRRGAGEDVELILDTNFNLRAEGSLRLARALEPLGLRWLEVDMPDASNLAALRRGTRTPIGSLETIFGPRAFAPFLEARAVDVAIIDVMWNGLLESLAMAQMADAYDVSMAPHNYAGPLSVIMGAHLAMLAPNLAIMEYDVEGPPWRDELVTRRATVEAGLYTPPDGPGWGCEIDETALARHAPGGG